MRYIWRLFKFGGLVISTSSPNLMYANANYNMSIIQAVYINIVPFAKLNLHQFVLMY